MKNHFQTFSSFNVTHSHIQCLTILLKNSFNVLTQVEHIILIN